MYSLQGSGEQRTNQVPWKYHVVWFFTSSVNRQHAEVNGSMSRGSNRCNNEISASLESKERMLPFPAIKRFVYSVYASVEISAEKIRTDCATVVTEIYMGIQECCRLKTSQRLLALLFHFTSTLPVNPYKIQGSR